MRHAISTCFTGLLSLWLLHSPAGAQQVVWSEDFRYFAQQNFNYPWGTAGSSYPWTCDYAYLLGTSCFPYIGNDTKVAGVSDYMLPPGLKCGQTNKHETDALLMTPILSFSNVQNAWFKYDSYFLKQSAGGKTESATVEISTDSGNHWALLKAAPVVPPGGYMNTSYIDLSGYNNASSIRLGFRYSDSGAYLNGWMIDNLRIFLPAAHDIALIHAYPEDTMLSYMAIPASTALSGQVMNTGTSAITAFDVQYREGTGPIQTHTVTGVNIAPFDTLGFVHAIPLSITTGGRHNLKMWVVLPGDTIQANDTLPLSLRGVPFIPTKKVAIEEGTGTWNLYGPRGYVYMHALDAGDDPPTRISIHSGDVMEHKAYSDYLYYMDQNFIPFFLFDRRGPVRHDVFFSTYESQRKYFGFADIDLRATAAGGYISADVTVRPAIDLPGNYRLALVITEDGVTGTGSGYAQANAYAYSYNSGREGPMGGFENKSNPVPASDMKYDYVTRDISPAPEGKIGCLPANMQSGGSYTCNLKDTYSSAWAFSRLNAIVLLIRDADSTILNSRTIPFRALGVENIAGKNGLMKVYPNPAGSSAAVAFSLPARSLTSFTVTDITGRTVFQYPAGWLAAGPHTVPVNVSGWPSGMYFLTLATGDKKETVKLSVVH